MWIQNGFRSSDSVSDADWCYKDGLTAPLFARLRQLHSFKQRLLSHLEHCPNQHCHPIEGLLSLLLTHHFLMVDVDCCLTCTSVIPIIIWFIVLALAHSNYHSTSVFVSQMDFHMRSQVHSFCSMLVHGNTLHSRDTHSLLRVPLLLFQQVDWW